jgi:molybdate transport system ATP-binding protein
MQGRPILSDNLLAVTMRHRVGSLSMDLNFALTQPWTILFGPSGSGKTTILRTIAGFVRPDTANIVYGPMERVLINTREHLFVPAHQRPVRTAGQAARLFPQLSVRENVMYGIGGSPHAHSDAEREVLAEVMELMRLTTLADRRPAGLSGGERQRVSVARAVAAAVTYDGVDKALLLLDEPFAGLDGVLRDELAVVLRNWLSPWKVPVLSVSHDVGECYLLDAEVVRMAEGQVIEQGPAAKVLSRERERLLSRLR